MTNQDAVAPVAVAIALRWRLVRDVLLDPFAWVGGVLIAAVAARSGSALTGESLAAVAPLAAGLLAVTVAALGANALLFETAENALLRTQPLGPRGLLTVRREELGWWMHPVALLAAAFGFGAAGLGAAAGAWVSARFATPVGLLLALRLRSPQGGRSVVVGAVAVAAGAVALLAFGREVPGVPPTVLLLGLAAGRLLDASWDARYEGLASDALAAPSRPRGGLLTGAARLLPLPAPLRVRVTRDLLLLARGADGRGALLLLLAPLSVLAIDLDPTPTAGQLLWRALSAAAMGAGAIAYAVGPGVHRLRVAVLPWARTAPHPGRRALSAGLAWGLGLATAHGLWVLAWIGLARGGWFLADLPALIGPVLGLELAMAHFSVTFSLTRASGRSLIGEGMLIFALPVVAISIALAGVLAPYLIPLYFLVTVKMMRDAAVRIDNLEVTW